MPRTLYVHLGPRKTGTTAIQGALRSSGNRTLLYPKVGLWNDGSHHGLVFGFFGEDRSPRGKTRKKPDATHLLEKLAREAANDDRDVLISSETLSTGRDFESFIRALLPPLNIGPENVEVLLACREHFGRAASLYNHRLRGSGESRTPDEFLRAIAHKLCYRPLVAELHRTGFKLSLINYHPSSTWVTRFLKHVGFLEENMPPVRWKNVALNSQALVTMLAVSQFTKSWEEKEKYLELFKERFSGAGASSSFIFGRKAATGADRRFGADREFLQEQFGISLTPPDFLNEECGLAIGNEEFAQIEEVAKSLGSEGPRIAEFARHYCVAPNTDFGAISRSVAPPAS